MSSTTHDDLETSLRELFERQSAAMPVGDRTWDEPLMASVSPMAPPRVGRSALAAIIAIAAAVALLIGIVAIAPGGRNGAYVGGQPGSSAAVHFATKQVSLAADGMTIEVGGRRFTAAGSTVDVHSDPGTPDKYTTIELIWNEGGVEMRLNIYFKSDGHQWWANEIRTYDGRSPGDWIEYAGTYFRTPLGTAFAGNVDLASTEGSGHLRFSNLTLQPFLPPAVCKNATTRYALDPSYDHVAMPDEAQAGFGLGITRLLDTASCTPVADSHAFVFDWKIDDPGIARLDWYHGIPAEVTVAPHGVLSDLDPTISVDLGRVGPGSTILHVTARERSTGVVVATTDIPVTVG